MIPGETILSDAPTTCPVCKTELTLRIHRSAAGYYIGTWCYCGPYSRESGYYREREDAEKALKEGFVPR
jgi:hypothetical protein